MEEYAETLAGCILNFLSLTDDAYSRAGISFGLQKQIQKLL